MSFKVVIQPNAAEEIEATYRYLASQVPETAARWFNGLEEAIYSLEKHPGRCALAPENDAVGREIRQLLYGRRNRKYRVLFTLQGSEVHVLHFRHWAERPQDID